MDDLAHALKLDPLAFRLKNLPGGRLRAVLEAAAKAFGWGKAAAPKGHGFGLAAGTEKGSYVAACAEVEANPSSGRVRVLRVVTAFECGAVLNPDHLKNQIEGATVMGLGGALFEEVRFADGKVLNPRFSAYRVPRFADVPALETVLLDRKDLPSAGAGETPIVAIAPAVGNAIFHATGLRLRSLPMVPEGLKGK
jgi:isoquinoline 1-oxidoreductase